MTGAPGRTDREPSYRPTRRDIVTIGTTVGSGLLAGCAGLSVPTGGSSGGSYSVEMAPIGEVEFEGVPESIFTRLTHLAGMAFALGRGNDVNAMHSPDYYDALWNQFTPRLPGIELDWSGLYSSWEPGRENLYELDSDVHLADPASVVQLESWDESDLDEIAENVGPWFGNTLSDRHTEPPSGWGDRYEYYGLWEMFERVARVFQAEDQYEALAEVHDSLLQTVEEGLPPESERPRAVMIGASSLDSIYAYTLDNPGFLTSHVRPLAPRAAFGDEVSSQSTIGMESLVAADPDVIFALGGFHPNTDVEEIRTGFQNHEAGRVITAVENDRIHAQGARYQGPIVNLFQIEMTAKQLYPDAFGEWPRYTEGPYPEISAEEQLFDRQRVADAIEGDL